MHRLVYLQQEYEPSYSFPKCNGNRRAHNVFAPQSERQTTVYPKSFAPLNTDIDSYFFRSFPASSKPHLFAIQMPNAHNFKQASTTLNQAHMYV